MKQLILTILANSFIFSTVLAVDLHEAKSLTGSNPFITVWKTDNQGSSSDNQITIPGEGSNYNIDWEELDDPDNSGNETGSGTHTITFPAPGTYRVSISGDFYSISFKGEDFHDYGDAKKILSIEQWGDIAWTSMESAFFRAANLNITADDAPDLSQVTSLAEMFFYASSMNADIGHWNTENIEDMSGMFYLAQSFNQDISGWNTENVTNMSKMFRLAFSFRQDLGDWDTSNVEDMSWMFSNYYESPTAGVPCSIDEPFEYVTYTSYDSFDQDISGWNTENVRDMSGMFFCAAFFNQDIGNWDTGNVTDMSYMFYNTRRFNQDIGNWNTGNVEDMSNMFNHASVFNQDIGSWDTGNVKKMRGMFAASEYYPVSFNQNIGGWNTEKVLDMRNMFMFNQAFNQDIGSWDTGNVEDMASMFFYAARFNQSIGSWDTGKVRDMSRMFSATAFNQDISEWNTGNVQDMSNMFMYTREFDQDIGSWDTGNVTNMHEMFSNADSFNQDIGEWNTGKVTNMGGMFHRAESYNQSMEDWDTGNVTHMSHMFARAASFNQNIGGWNIENVTNMNFMLSYSGLSIANYDSILIGWAEQSLQDNITLGVHELQFHAGKDARELIKNNYGWSFINDSYSVDSSAEPPNRLPDHYAIQQNYPNPFNPATVIRFTVPEQAHVNITVYNLIGQRIETLINETKSPGRYEVLFESNRLSSGVYIYRMQAGDFVSSKKMILAK
ncbi:BspA family leucine-rich repeat surface protein [Balneolaceae bacterium ANBcel3]|nr:BspA family leucine-rich repeat surface protein [Balneolaceae bacterium ANBcel3]